MIDCLLGANVPVGEHDFGCCESLYGGEFLLKRPSSTPPERLCSSRQLSRAWQILSKREYVMAKRKMSTFERLRTGKMNRKGRKQWQQRLCAGCM